MKLRRLVALFVLSAGLPILAESPVPRGGPHDYYSLPADLSSPAPFERRFMLEQRRAGGPRPEVVGELLSEGLRANSPRWVSFVLESCQAGLVNCGQYLESTRQWAGKQPAEFQKATDSALKSIAQEAEIQAMTPKQRQDLYGRALRQGAVYDDTSRFYLDAGNAARRVIREGMSPLFDDVVASIEAHPGMKAIAADLTIARAMEARDPDGELLKLVARGAEADLRWIKESHEAYLQGGAAPAVPDTALFPAHFALDALRKRNTPGVAKELRKILVPYEAESPQLARRIQSVKGTEEPETKRPQQGESSPLGSMGWHLVETIGDLGDRDLERRALGGRTLWDQVNEVEKELVKRGKLPRSAMVASVSQ